MTITTTALGSYTTQITLAGELNSTGFMAALDAAIVAGGWIQHDISNQYYRVYKSLNIDGTSYKYAAVNVDVYKQRFWLSSFESWNATTHVGTNETYTHHGGYWLPYTFNNCDVIVYSSPRWLGFLPYIRNTPALHPVFVLETTRDHPQDTAAAGYPCWGWMTPAATSEAAPVASGNAISYLFATPRNRIGQTGGTAAASSFIATTFNRIHNTTYGSGPTVTGFNGGLSNVLSNTSSDAWDSLASYTHTLRVGHGLSGYQGRIAGMKGSKVPNAGLMNRVTVPVDSKFIYDSAGTPTEHWILPINSSIPITTTSGSANLATGAYMIDAVWNGSTLFISRSSNSVVRYDLNTNTLGTPIEVTGLVVSMVFDGSNIYFANQTRIGKWDTTTDTITYSATATGGSMNRLCFDGTNIWALDLATTSGLTTIRKYDTSLALISTFTIATATNHQGADIIVDSYGNLAAITLSNSSGYRITKINTITNAVVGQLVSTSNMSIASCQLTGTRGLIDLLLTVSGNSTSLQVDIAQSTPVAVATSSTIITYQSNSGNTGVYQGAARYGRMYYYVGNSFVTIHDYELTSPSDQVTTTLSGNSGFALVHFGTHVLHSNNAVSQFTPTAGFHRTPVGGQLLLPK